jgi:hypothetical protein
MKDAIFSKRRQRPSLSRRHHPHHCNAPLVRLLWLLALIMIVSDHCPQKLASRWFQFCPTTMLVHAANYNDDYYGDGAAAAADDAAATDDAANADGADDANADGAADNAAAADDAADQSENEAQGDDKFGFQSNGFGSVSVMPTSCIT